MLHSLLRLLFFVGVVCYCSALLADEILVVVGQISTTDKISIKQLSNIYRRKTVINEAGEHWNPINLSANDPLRLAFTQKIFQQPPEVMEAYWNAQYFQGIMPPYAVNSVEAMLRVLENTKGAIGYILPCHLDKRVKVVLKITVNEALSNECNR